MCFLGYIQQKLFNDFHSSLQGVVKDSLGVGVVGGGGMQSAFGGSTYNTRSQLWGTFADYDDDDEGEMSADMKNKFVFFFDCFFCLL